jgi:hypothetical protein
LANNVINGKGNEWALAKVFSGQLEVPIRQDSAAEVAKASYEALPSELRERFDRSGALTSAHLLRLEHGKLMSKPPRQIRLAGDSEGKVGDVRDVLVTAGEVLFGVSCKSNHDAYKHSRLSSSIDWVERWGISTSGCSEDYWSAINPVFADLLRIKEESGGKALFRELPDLHGQVYAPILDAFEKELKSLFSIEGEVEQNATALVKYVVGKEDFYKAVSREKEVDILTFNFNGSLAGARTKAPSKVLSVDRAEGSSHSINVRFDRGYVFNFRIHNASSRVEPSLKFDIQAVGLPANEIRHHNIAFDFESNE